MTNDVVLAMLMESLTNLPPDTPLVGELEDGRLRMPLNSSDGRRLTWTKYAGRVASEIVNQPTSEESCWFLKSNTNDQLHSAKFSKTGSRSKWLTHRVLYVLMNPTALTLVEDRASSKDIHFSHRCGHGRGDLICVNPWHIILASPVQNQDHKGCTYGAYWLCPHKPKCLWTWPDTGQPKACFNKPAPVACECPRRCCHQISCV
jgi:hypothetical protein